QSRVLHTVASEPTDAVDRHRATRAQLTGSTELLHAAVRGQPCVGQRREVLWFLIAVHLNEVTVGHGYVLGEPPGGPKPIHPPLPVQSCSLPSWHSRQLPSPQLASTTTRPPSERPAPCGTSAPTRSTWPAISWPGMKGKISMTPDLKYPSTSW